MIGINLLRPRPIAILSALVLGLLFGGNANGQQESSPANLQKVLVEILERQAAAWNDGDLERFMDAYWKSEELTFCSGGNITRGWKATLERYRHRYGDKEKMGQLKFAELEVMPLGTDAALMLGEWQLTAKGQNFGGNFSLVWRKIDDHWKIIHDHTSLSEPSEKAAPAAEKR